jgi:hypothetical protein
VSWVSSPLAVWASMVFLLTIHLSMNYAAVRAVSLRSLNRQRANIVLSHLLTHDKVLTPQQVSKRERIFERDGVLRWTDGQVIGYGQLGISFSKVIRGLGVSSEITGAVQLRSQDLSRLLNLYTDEGYVLWFDSFSSTAYIALKRGSSSQSHLKAWCQALIIANELKNIAERLHMDNFEVIASSLARATKLFEEEYPRRLKAEDWDLSIAALETHSGSRLMWKQENAIVKQYTGA